MKLAPIASNMTQLELTDGTTILFSYTTPVAAQIPGFGYIRTEEFFSRTTNKHISKWIMANGGVPTEATKVEQSMLESLVDEIR